MPTVNVSISGAKSPVIAVGLANSRIAVPTMNAAHSVGPSFLSAMPLRSKVKNTISGLNAITIAITTIGHSAAGRCSAAMLPTTTIIASKPATTVMLKP